MIDIKKDKQITKMSYYGFLKNLRFFEPYLMIYFIESGLSFFQIGLLFSIREIVIYLFEIPSGIIADYYGKKNELMACFVFYIISFILFFIDGAFIFMAIAMIFYGLGDAFRSGTHKSMIYSYLEKKGMFDKKAEVYGYTRSYSKIGSSISSFLSIFLILNMEYYKTIFLFSIVPYILDFLLILSYPNYLNERREGKASLKRFFELIKIQVKSILNNKALNKMVLNSSLYNSVFKSIKDYIQPVIAIALISSIELGAGVFTAEQLTKIYLGLLYGIFSIFSAITARNAFKIKKLGSSKKMMEISFLVLAFITLGLSVTVHFEITIVVFILYLYLYISKDFRKPLFVDYAGENMKQEERATVMSYNSQLEATGAIILAPIIGLLADGLGLSIMFLGISSLIFVTSYFLVKN